MSGGLIELIREGSWEMIEHEEPSQTSRMIICLRIGYSGSPNFGELFKNNMQDICKNPTTVWINIENGSAFKNCSEQKLGYVQFYQGQDLCHLKLNWQLNTLLNPVLTETHPLNFWFRESKVSEFHIILGSQLILRLLVQRTLLYSG